MPLPFAKMPFAAALLLTTSLGMVSYCHADNENLALGNPSAAVVLDTTKPLDDAQADNLLEEKPAYSLSYNRSNGGPNWVSWHLVQSHRGRSGRSDDFRPDATLPATAQIRPTDYRGSGYDRGHQCPSGDRTADADLNSQTFLMSNVLPQTPDLNRQLWRKFEEYCRDQLKSGENEEYVICGGVGTLKRIAGGKVNVPASCWKIAVILADGDDDLKRITADTRVVAVLMPNANGPEIASGKWSDYLTSVDKIEAATGLDLLSNVPVEVQAIIEARIDSGRAPSRKAVGGAPEFSEHLRR
jgi:endonuclease G